jgi:hypothetical protein
MKEPGINGWLLIKSLLIIVCKNNIDKKRRLMFKELIK